MIIKAKLFFRNEEIELLTFDLTLSRDFNTLNGRPTSMLLKVPVKVTYISRENDSIFFEYMKKERLDREDIKPPYNTYDIFSYKIVLYQDDYDGPAIKTFYFENGLPTYYKEEFTNQTGMITTLQLEAAVIHVGDGLYVNTFWDETMRKRLESQATSNKPKPAESFYVDAISIEALEEGSSNSSDIFSPPKKGMVYGKEYTLKVTKYRNDKAPSNLNKIKWRCNYINADQQIIMGKIEQCGDEITFKADNLDYCGCTLTFHAYIGDGVDEASLDVFHHYRFKWFNRDTVLTQIENRTNDPWKISQRSSSLCGMAALFYILIKKDPRAYRRLAETLHRKGTATINGYTIEPHPKALEMYEARPTHDANYISMDMAEIDWILLAVARSKESLHTSFVYKGIEQGSMDMLKAVNWPRMMERMAKELGGTNVKSTGLNELLIQQKKRPLGGRIYDYFSDSDLQHLQDIDAKYKAGKHIIMMVDAQMLDDIVSYSYNDIAFESHWVVYEGNLQFFDKDGFDICDIENAVDVGFKVYTWGRNPETGENEKGEPPISKLIKHQKISIKSFKSTFYGYIETN